MTDGRVVDESRDGKVWAVETITCEGEGKCSHPVPLISSTHPIREIGYIASPDSRPSGELHMWVGGKAGKEYSIRIALAGHSPS